MIGKKTPEVQAFWEKARKAKNIQATGYVASTFSDPKFSTKTDYISGLAAEGVKRGTCHLALDFEVNNVTRRKPGDYWVVLDGQNKPLAVVRVTKVEVKPFDQIGEDFSSVENEGDGSFKYWYDGHLGYFERQCAGWGKKWRMDQPCVCEHFDLIYKP